MAYDDWSMQSFYLPNQDDSIYVLIILVISLVARCTC